MTCPVCGEKTTVLDSRSDGETVVRKRRCVVCKHKFYTQECDCDVQDYHDVCNKYLANRKKEDVVGGT